MKIAGIIAEYNPFHKGHAYHIQKTRELTGADFVIVVISGDFVQRGAPAFFPKDLRAHMALLGGADLVFELPAISSCESAEFFAAAGVQLLDGLGCVDVLSFGSEAGDIRIFQEAASFFANETTPFQNALRSHLKTGMSYPAARTAAFLSSFPPSGKEEKEIAKLLSSPNNILGIEYCKALLSLQSPIQPVTIIRKGSSYHEQNLSESYPSASALRKALTDIQKNDVPKELSSGFPDSVWNLLEHSDWKHLLLREEDFSLLFRHLLYGIPADRLAACQDMTPDLLSRILNTRDQYENFSQYVSLLKTRELTYSRISRTLFHALLNIQEVPPIAYARLLGFRRSALPVLGRIKQQGTLPVISKLADVSKKLSPDARNILEENIRISHLYESVLCEKYSRSFTNEYRRQLIIL